MKFEFQSTNEDGDVVSHQFEAGTWYEVLDHFVKFLRGSGYSLQNNSVGINESAGHWGIEDYYLDNITTFSEE